MTAALVFLAAMTGAHVALMAWHLWLAISLLRTRRQTLAWQERCIDAYRELLGMSTRREISAAIASGWNRKRDDD